MIITAFDSCFGRNVMAENSSSQSWLSVCVAFRVSGSACSLSKRAFHWRSEQLPLTGCAPSSLYSTGYDSVKGGNILFLPLPSQRPVCLPFSSYLLGYKVIRRRNCTFNSSNLRLPWSLVRVCVFYSVKDTVRRHPAHPFVFAKDGRTPSWTMAQQVPSHLLADRGRGTNDWQSSGGYQIFKVRPSCWICSSPILNLTTMKRRKAELEKQEVRKKCWLPVQECKLARGMCWLQVAPNQLPNSVNPTI